MLSSQDSQLAMGGSDRLRFAAGFFFLLTLTVAAFASGRLHFGLDVPTPLRDAAIIAFVPNGLLQTWAMLVNPFSSPVVRLQTKRGHHVIAECSYRFVRHPGYLAMLVAVPARAIAPGSWIALTPADGFIATIAKRARIRARIEDEFLMQNLAGSKSSATQIRGGLFPEIPVE
jgi:protein-S-isoprenylcysteine O-methyltransferase Ste14